jgi:hypothetical protein
VGKPSSRGREFIGHPPGGHDDLAAAAAVAVAHAGPFNRKVTWLFGNLGGSNPDDPIYSDQSLTAPAIDAEAPTPSDPDYYDMHRIRNCERRNGEPLPWKEIRERVAKQNEIERKWALKRR